MKRLWISVVLLAAVVALPIMLKRETPVVSPQRADDHLVILTPHNETIRREFARAFATWWHARSGRSLYVDWRTPGGSSEIRMIIDDGFKAAKETGRDGIGMDVLFGGGEHDFSSQAKLRRFERIAAFAKHPEWFGEHAAVPQWHTGERYFPDDHTWVAACLSQFGICYNRDILDRINVPPPSSWNDLTDPRLANQLVLADPTKSGSVARAFELVIQEAMQRAIARHGEDARAQGWDEGWRMVMKLAANARYFTDSASKIPHDVGQGNAAAGMCIDFYGRSYHAALLRADGHSRLDWIAPRGGASYGADPVAVFKGAPHAELAQAFVEFCLTPEGQILWFAKPGTPHGPAERALHRLPVRRDVFSVELLERSTMPDAAPYGSAGDFTYRKDLTGPAFNTLRALIKAACIDSHDELQRAWLAMRDAGFPADAMAVCFDVSAISYAKIGKGDAVLDGNDPVAAAERSMQLGEWFRGNFRKAEAMAKGRQAR